jgi:hypothetical protein
METGDRLAVLSGTTSTRQDARKLPVVTVSRWLSCIDLHDGHYA